MSQSRHAAAGAFRPRVLLISEAANPEWVSVPLVGWSHSRALAALTDAHLVTQIRNREAIVRAGLVEGRDFTAIDSEALAAGLYRLAERLRGGAGKGWTTLAALAVPAYYYFEQLVWRRFGERLRRGEFDLVHRLTPLSPTTPSLLARRCRQLGVPFVLGPLNGGLPWPPGFEEVRRREREWLSYLRGAYRLLPAYRATRREAAAILVGSRATLAQMPRRYHGKCVYIPENAIEPARFDASVDRPAGRPLQLVFVGRLVPYKGADMLLEAAAPSIRAGRAALTLIGDGPQRPQLEQRIRELSIDAGVRLTGWVEHRRLQDRLLAADVFGFPSVREFGGGVLLEAMALGLVPIVVDYGGPGELVTDATGFRIPLGRREQIVERFRAILERLLDDPTPLRAMGRRARQRVLDHFTWEAKARQVREVYRWVLGERPDRPDFGLLPAERPAPER